MFVIYHTFFLQSLAYEHIPNVTFDSQMTNQFHFYKITEYLVMLGRIQIVIKQVSVDIQLSCVYPTYP